MKQFDIITFDCYGTLIDWEKGIVEAFMRAAAEDGVRLDESRIVSEYSAAEPIIERGHYQRYRNVLGDAAELLVVGAVDGRAAHDHAATSPDLG